MTDPDSANQHPVNQRAKAMLKKLHLPIEPAELHAIQLIRTHLENGQHHLSKERADQQLAMLDELMWHQAQTKMEVLGLVGEEQSVQASVLARVKEPAQVAQVLIDVLHNQMSELIETYS